MKKIILVLIAVAIFIPVLLPTQSNAVSVDLDPSSIDFEMRTTSINNLGPATIIKFKSNFINGEDNFDYWKVRIECGVEMFSIVENTTSSACNNNVKVLDSKDGFYVIFVNKSVDMERVGLKFKAYDNKGDFKKSQRMNFVLPSNK